VARDLVLLVARVGLGVIMVAHAELEYDFGGGLSGVGRLFEQAGVPLPAVTGPADVLFELVGGIAMIIGVAVPVVGVLMALNMAGAWIFVHTSQCRAVRSAERLRRHRADDLGAARHRGRRLGPTHGGRR
jgi:putative oxidoreductase